MVMTEYICIYIYKASRRKIESKNISLAIILCYFQASIINSVSISNDCLSSIFIFSGGGDLYDHFLVDFIYLPWFFHFILFLICLSACLSRHVRLFKSFEFGNGSRLSDENLVILEFKYLQNKK